MGIKHFASWFNNNFKEFVIPFSKTNFPLVHIDTFLIDLNGIFHTSAQKVFKYGNCAPPPSVLRKSVNRQPLDKLTIECYIDVIHTIDLLVSITRPQKTLVLAIDGVAPMAKQQQQRQRRYKSAVENINSKSDANTFNPTSISTGTKFMDGLSKYISNHIDRKIASEEWNFEVVFTNEKCPGEGEHKLINYIRLFGGDNDTFCLNALDADLFMLSLGTMKEKFYLLREELYIPSIDYMYVDIGKTRKQLIKNLAPSPNELGSDYSIIKDFILICFLCGNDFLPNIPSINICEQGLSRLLDIYKKFGKRIVVDTKIDTQLFVEFLTLVSHDEEKMFANKIAHASQYMPDPIISLSTCSESKFSFPVYKQLYNDKYFPDTLTDASTTYVEGCQWILDYYLGGTQDWEWSYKYNYAPFITDIITVADKANYVCIQTTPITAFAQLMCILPPPSFNLLPKPLHLFYLSHLEYYPQVNDIDINYDGKKYKWEGVINLPPINFDDIRADVNALVKNVDRRELLRNVVENPITYIKENQGSSYVLNKDGSISLGNGVGKKKISF